MPPAAGSRTSAPGASAYERGAYDGSGQRELRGAEALDDVAAAHAPGVLERAQHRVGRGEAAGHALGGDGAAGEHAVPGQQHLDVRGRAQRGVGDDRGRRRPRPVAMAGPPRSAAAPPPCPHPDRPDDGPAGDSPL